jgi:hypothetical protein
MELQIIHSVRFLPRSLLREKFLLLYSCQSVRPHVIGAAIPRRTGVKLIDGTFLKIGLQNKVLVES